MKRWAIASLPLLVILALVVPSRASPQSGVFCPDTGAVIITMLDGTYFGTATQVDGGLYAGYIFWAQDPFSSCWQRSLSLSPPVKEKEVSPCLTRAAPQRLSNSL